jgi:galactose mutarotase-like enzyme
MNEIELQSGEARLRIATLGAECRAWSVGDRDLLWTPDTTFWDAVAPVLFPVCGWTRDGRMRVGSQTYPLGLHGFARHSAFRVAEVGVDHARHVLRDDPATRALYPFPFELSVSYRLAALTLEAEIDVRNTGRGPMPYAVGLHPGFRIDPARSYAVVFDETETADVPVIASGGLFSNQRRAIPLEGRRLAIRDDTFAREALCFVPARSQGLELDYGDGMRLRVDLQDFPNIVLWSRPGAPFLCIEPWTGFGDPEGFGGDIFDKPGMRLLMSGDRARHRAMFTLHP